MNLPFFRRAKKKLGAVAWRTSERGSSDLTVALLLTAAGAAMVGMTVPSMFKSSDTAAKTFDKQVKVLERGANGGASSPAGNGFSSSSPNASPNFDLGSAPGVPARGASNLVQPAAGTPAAGAVPAPTTAQLRK